MLCCVCISIFLCVKKIEFKFMFCNVQYACDIVLLTVLVNNTKKKKLTSQFNYFIHK